MLIPPNLFKENKPLLLVELPFCFQNEKASKQFVKKLNWFTNGHYEIKIIWVTRKLKTLFQLKDKNPYPSCVIYRGDCVCGESYVGETVRNAESRWKKHNDTKKESEPAKHLRDNPSHSFTWKLICTAPN